MPRCSNKNYFVKLISVFNWDEYVYPLNKETVLKSKREYKKIVNIDYNKTYVKHHEECKFIESNKEEAIKLEFRPLWSKHDENDKIIWEDGYMNEEIMKLVLEDNSYFEIIENLIIKKSNNESDKKFYLDCFYCTFIRHVPEFKDILFEKLEARDFLNTGKLLEAITKYNPTIEEIDKYIPKHLIPTEENYLSIIKKYGYNRDLNPDKGLSYDLRILGEMDPRFAKFLIDTDQFVSDPLELLWFYQSLTMKNWKCFLNIGIVFKNVPCVEETLENNPCLIIYYPEKYHNEERYLNALKADIMCYPYLYKKYITPKIREYFSTKYLDYFYLL